MNPSAAMTCPNSRNRVIGAWPSKSRVHEQARKKGLGGDSYTRAPALNLPSRSGVVVRTNPPNPPPPPAPRRSTQPPHTTTTVVNISLRTLVSPSGNTATVPRRTDKHLHNAILEFIVRFALCRSESMAKVRLGSARRSASRKGCGGPKVGARVFLGLAKYGSARIEA